LTAAIAPADSDLIKSWRDDWLKYSRDVLRVKLDRDQEKILHSIQVNPRTVIRSGHARGKDFVCAAAAMCFVNLLCPSKVILTGPTDRQVVNILIAECKEMWNAANEHIRRLTNGQYQGLGGAFGAHKLLPDPNSPNWFLLGFKASDTSPTSWTGYHSPNILVIATEASGLPQETFDSIEGLLQGNSRMVMALNPTQMQGEAYKAFKSPLYTKFILNCMESPNVLAKKIVIPGQVDWDWINNLIQKPGWVTRIDESEMDPKEGDFQWPTGIGWEYGCYQPSDLFRTKVLGMYPKEGADQLIPLAWVEASNERWRAWRESGSVLNGDPLKLGVDVAGMGRDAEVFCHRYDILVLKFEAFAKSDHMGTAGKVKAILDTHAGSTSYIDTIGEGAGVNSRLVEQKANSISVKFSEGAGEHKDLTGERQFANMRAYCWWAVRDALDPKLDGQLALPPIDELTQDLTAPTWKHNSAGKILIQPKDEIKVALGRSPDHGDALTMTYYPEKIKRRMGSPGNLGRG